jgi:hypothetical protein
MRTLVGRFLFELAIDLAVLRLLDLPLRRILRLPAVGAPLEIVTEGDRMIIRTNQERVSGRRRMAEAPLVSLLARKTSKAGT